MAGPTPIDSTKDRIALRGSLDGTDGETERVALTGLVGQKASAGLGGAKNSRRVDAATILAGRDLVEGYELKELVYYPFAPHPRPDPARC